ncbi:MAG: hypothetical protein KDN20_01155 [Verrucomicrobiae bacterium]|nr:hypothetical protein [Verrucomicrobiae bacterium]
MAHLPLILVFVLLAGLDVAAILVAVERIGSAALPAMPAAVGIHLLVCAIALAATRFYPGAKERPGYRTLGILTAIICLLTPVLGCLVGAWIMAGATLKRRTASPFDGIRLGNPFSEASRIDRPSIAPITQPLVSALRQGHRPAQRLAAPMLRQHVDRRAIGVLRHLRDQPDARTQLYAQGALSTLFENRERQLEQLRLRVSETPADHLDALAIRERLASALWETAESQLHGQAESNTMIEEALSQFDGALSIDPADAACLYGKARCLIRLSRLDSVPDLYGKLCALPGASSYADRLEPLYFAAVGNWQRTADTVRRLVSNGNPTQLAVEQRDFWFAQSVSAGK